MTTKARFIIADQALKSVTGHFYEYDVSVAANVPEPYEPLIVANSEAGPEVLSHASPFFQCDFWGPTAMRRSKLGGDKPRRLADLRVAARGIAAQTHLLPLLQLMRRMVERSRTALRDTIARGGAARPPDAAGFGAGQLNGGERWLKDIFLQDLVELFETYAIAPQDVLFFPNMNHWTLAAVAELQQNVPFERWPALKLLFRRNIDTISRGSVSTTESAYWAGVLRRSFDLLASPMAAGRLNLYTDTTRLQAEYAIVSSFAFIVLPIPFRHDYIALKAMVPETFQVAYFGEARLEKGFGHLPALVEQFYAERESGRVRFVFQAVPAPEPAVMAAINQLRSMAGVTLLDKPLSDQEYYALLNSSDVVLLLYEPLRYFSRSSCIFIESVVSATPCVTFANSWMASVMEPGTGEIVESASEIPTALRKILDGYSGYQAAIAKTGQRWRKYHNPRHLVELLLNGAADAVRAQVLAEEV